MRLLLSIIMGLVPEVLYFTLFLIYTKNLKDKQIKLFFLIAMSYFVCVLMQKYEVLYYVLSIFFIYLILKILYREKTQIIDVFVISLMCLWLTVLSFISLILLNNNFSNFYVLYFVSRILLFLPFIFKNKFNVLYKNYCKFWNRNDKEKRPIKSITLRNISLILLNGFIFLLNTSIINMIKYLK